MSKAHKATNQAFRDGWDRTFLLIGKRSLDEGHTARIYSFMKPLDRKGVPADESCDFKEEFPSFDEHMVEMSGIREEFIATGLHSLKKAADKALEIEEQFNAELNGPFFQGPLE